MENSDRPYSGQTVSEINYNGFSVYNPRQDLLQDNKTNDEDGDYKPISSRFKKAVTVASLSTGSALLLAMMSNDLPYQYDFVGAIAAPLLFLTGLSSYMSSRQVTNPPRYNSFREMMVNIRRDTEPKNRIYQYFKRKFGRDSPSALEAFITRPKETYPSTPSQIELDAYFDKKR